MNKQSPAGIKRENMVRFEYIREDVEQFKRDGSSYVAIHVDHMDYVFSVAADGTPNFYQHTTDYSLPKSFADFTQRAKDQGKYPFRMWHIRIVHT